MSGRKSNLRLFQNITAGDMSQASITSIVSNIQMLDNVGLQLSWTGSPVGTFAVQVSADHAQDEFGNVTTAGQWAALTLTYFTSGSFVTATSIPTSVGSPIYLDLQQLSAPWIRIVYTRGSGSGTLSGYITAKMV